MADGRFYIFLLFWRFAGTKKTSHPCGELDISVITFRTKIGGNLPQID